MSEDKHESRDIMKLLFNLAHCLHCSFFHSFQLTREQAQLPLLQMASDYFDFCFINNIRTFIDSPFVWVSLLELWLQITFH